MTCSEPNYCSRNRAANSTPEQETTTPNTGTCENVTEPRRAQWGSASEAIERVLASQITLPVRRRVEGGPCAPASCRA